MLPDPNSLKQKAREISYALIRVSYYVKRTEFRSELEKLAVELLKDVSQLEVDSNLDNTNKSLSTISVLDGIVRLAHSIYEIEPVNATILVRELDGLNTAMRKYGNLPDNNEAITINNLFSHNNESHDKNNRNFNEKNDNGNNNKNGNSAIKAAMRYPTIINRVKSNNNCRLKDVIAEFPDVSERTLRYDLKKLCERGVIERVGNGGPASHYQFRDTNV